MKTIKRTLFFGIFCSSLLLVRCDENGNFILFSLQNDIELGAQVAEQIASDPDQFPILPRTSTNAQAYAYLDNMVASILDAQDDAGNDAVTYRTEFAWEVQIIKDDNVLNAFATPGGYIYIYTGLIKFLDRADDLAGVIGHEIAHADQRHSSKQLQRQYGVSLLLSIALGEEPSELAELVSTIAGTLGSLSFSRNLESEADEFSVIYLADTDYACNGAFSFFQKLIDQQQTGNTPKFLSTHPDPASRVDAINDKATALGCSTDAAFDNEDDLQRKEYLFFKCDYLPDGCD